MDTSKKYIVLIVTLASLFIFGATLVKALWYAPESEVPAPALQESAPIDEASDAAKPRKLIIPEVGVDADIQYVGVAASGNMAVPDNYTDVGWFRYGPLPGQVGSAVIDGHVDNALGLDGVFKHLDQLKRGDDVYVETKGGDTLHFVVERVVTYGYKDVPGDLLFERTDARRLNLITCGGSWVRSEKTYDRRVVVYTVLAS